MPSEHLWLETGAQAQAAGDLERAFACFEAASEAIDPRIVSEALRRRAGIHRCRCEWDKAAESARMAAEVARNAGLEDLAAEALNAEGIVYFTRGDLAAARPLFERAATAADARVRGLSLQNLGSVAAQRGQRALAEQHWRASLHSFEQAGYVRGEALVLTNYAASAIDAGDGRLAKELSERAVEAALRLDDLDVLAIARKNLAESLLLLGESLDRAEELASATLGYFVAGANRWRVVECYTLLGDLNARRGETSHARSCWERGLTIAEEIGATGDITRLRDRLHTGSRHTVPGTRHPLPGS
jgi:tetratricopeptide (TPR) repeat protein